MALASRLMALASRLVAQGQEKFGARAWGLGHRPSGTVQPANRFVSCGACVCALARALGCLVDCFCTQSVKQVLGELCNRIV